MAKELTSKPWSPYLAGALSGVAMILSVWVSGKYFGASTTFVKSAGMIEKAFCAQKVARMDYFVKEVPKIDWQWMFVIGILIGSLMGSTTSGGFRWKAVPDMWETRFGPSRVKRGIMAFIGGLIAMFGARLADGCPSGHGLSGSLQLAVSGFISLLCFFIGGIIVARILYRGGNDP